MKLVVGLGNPGLKYSKTRHNVGYMILDDYLGKVNWKKQFDSYYYNIEVLNENVIFLKPTTYMNLSGVAVKKVVDFYKIPITNILVIQDDVDMAIGSYKIKQNSSSGGHNGIKSIIKELGTDSFARLKIGIAKSEIVPTDKYVLEKFKKDEYKLIMDQEPMFRKIIDTFIKQNLEKVMLLFNKK